MYESTIFNIDTANLQGHFTCVLISCAGHGHVLGFYDYLHFVHPYFDLFTRVCTLEGNNDIIGGVPKSILGIFSLFVNCTMWD